MIIKERYLGPFICDQLIIPKRVTTPPKKHFIYLSLAILIRKKDTPFGYVPLGLQRINTKANYHQFLFLNEISSNQI